MAKAKVDKFAVGNIVTATVIRNKFDRHAIIVLLGSEYIAHPETERQKREQQKYKIVKELPELNEYSTLRDNKYRAAIVDVLDDARSEIESLKDELNDWYENLPESFQNGDKGQMLQDAISQLESCEVPEIDDSIGKLMLVVLPPNNKSTSRAARRDDVAYTLSNVSDWIDAEINGETKKYDDDMQESLESLHSDLDSAINELEGVEFPGMY